MEVPRGPKTLQNINRVPYLDDPWDPSAPDPPAGAGESSGALQGLLQQIHHLPQGQDAE